MNKKSLFVLAGVAVVAAAVAAAVSHKSASADAAGGAVGKKFFPELVVNDVAKLTLVGASTPSEPDAPTTVETFVVQKSGDTWGAAEKGGYPVDVGKVKQLVIALSEMNVVAEMTRKPDGYSKLGVEEVSEPKAESKRVTVEDKNGKVVADVLIGKPRNTRNFGGKPGLYVRRVGDAQAFEVNGQVTVAVDPQTWLDREVAKVDAARVRKVTTTHTDGAQLVVSKNVAEDTNYAVEGLPEGKELMWPGVANQLGGALQYLNLEDVQKAGDVDMSGATLTEFVTFDGMVVTAKTVEKDGKTWLALSAAFDPAQVKDEVTVEAPPAEPKEGEPPPVEPPKKAARKTPEEVQKEVEALNAKVSPWVFAIPGYTAANFRKHVDDLLKKDEPPAAEDGAALDPLGLDDETTGIEDHAGHDHDITPPPQDTPPTEPPPTPPDEPKQHDPASKPPGGGI